MNLKEIDWSTFLGPWGGWGWVPPGFYHVVLKEASEEVPRNGGGAYIRLSHTVCGGEYHGRLVHDFLHVKHENYIAQKIAFGKIWQLLNATGMLGIANEFNELKGRGVGIEIRSIERKDKPGNVIAKVHRYLPLDSREMLGLPIVPPLPVEPRQAGGIDATPHPSRKPWKR